MTRYSRNRNRFVVRRTNDGKWVAFDTKSGKVHSTHETMAQATTAAADASSAAL